MGSLNLPSAGWVYLDTDVFIYSVEKIHPYWQILLPLWQAVQSEQLTIVSSELTLLETLVKPAQTGDNILENSFRNLLLNSSDVELLPIHRSILEQAINLRASFSLRTPDAIHAATALATNCALFVSNDKIFKRVPDLPVTILNDLIE